MASRRIEHHRLGAGPCRGNSDRLTQLIGNLVANADMYGLPDRPIHVTSSVDERRFLVAVHNEGAPIAEDLLPRLFDPMTRGQPTGGDQTSLGLGLFIVREIAAAHGGTVEVVTTPDDGTTFTASFPRRGPAGAAT